MSSHVHVQIPQLDDLLTRLLDRLEDLEARVQRLEAREELPTMVTLKQAASYKGVNEKTLRNYSWKQPPLEKRRAIKGANRYAWPRDVVIEWAEKSDIQLQAEWEARLKAD